MRRSQTPLMQIRTRLIVVVTLVLIGAFLATNLVSYEVSRRAMRETLLEDELPLTGDTIYSEIQIDLVRPVFVASLMATDTFLRDWVLAGEAEPKRLVRYLDAIRTEYDAFTAFFVSEATRRYYHFSGVTKTVARDDPRDAWFFRVRGMERPYEINVDPNQAQDDAITIFINYRVKDYAGEFIGATGVGLRLDSVARIVERYGGRFDRTVYFVDGDGRVTVHPDPTRAYSTRLAEIPGMAPHAGRIAAGERLATVVERPAGDVLMTTRYIPELDWTLVVEADEDAAMSGLTDSFLSNFLIGLAAIAVTAGAIAVAISRYQRRLESAATVDPLTGLANRQFFDGAVAQAVQRARRTRQPLGLALLDLDSFKAVNDRHGHLFGDRVLQSVARLTRESVRKSDLVARWGGEELVVLMEDCTADKAADVADAIRRTIRESDDLAGAGPDDGPLTASLGVSAYIPDGADVAAGADDEAAVAREVERLVAEADAALYRAKRDGRDRVESVRAEAA